MLSGQVKWKFRVSNRNTFWVTVWELIRDSIKTSFTANRTVLTRIFGCYIMSSYARKKVTARSEDELSADGVRRRNILIPILNRSTNDIRTKSRPRVAWRTSIVRCEKSRRTTEQYERSDRIGRFSVVFFCSRRDVKWRGDGHRKHCKQQ